MGGEITDLKYEHPVGAPVSRGAYMIPLCTNAIVTTLVLFSLVRGIATNQHFCEIPTAHGYAPTGLTLTGFIVGPIRAARLLNDKCSVFVC